MYLHTNIKTFDMQNITTHKIIEEASRTKPQKILCSVFGDELGKQIESRIYSIYKTNYISYLDKIKCIKFNISISKNRTLFEALLNGNISVQNIVSMKSDEMATYDKIKDRDVAKKRDFFEGYMSAECRLFQQKSILLEDQCKKTKLWGGNEQTSGKLN